MTNPIKLYVSEEYREPSLYTLTELMYPFWGVTAKESMPFVRRAAEQYQFRKDDFTLVDSIEDTDYVLIPYSYDRLKTANTERLARIVEDAERAQKPLLIDGAGDIEHPIPHKNAAVLRVSQFSYSVQPNEIAIPFGTEDLLFGYRDSKLVVRTKPERPSVGFTGWAGQSFKGRIRTAIKELPVTLASLIDTKRGAEHKGILFRARALKALANDPRVDSRFTARTTYSGHTSTIQGSVTDVRTQFVDALDDCDYAVCVRGDANASVRFYEALSLGRIPLFLDTACVLPLEDKIDYRSFCVYVDWRDTDRINEKLLEFHASVSPEQFEEMQRKARAAYEQFLRIDSFSPHLAEKLTQMKASFTRRNKLAIVNPWKKSLKFS